MKSTASNRARSKKQKALQLIEQKRHRDALPLLEYVCKKVPGDGQALMILGATYGQLGNLMAAIHCSEKAVDLLPGNVQALDNLALAYQLYGQVEKACVIWKRRLMLDPRHRETVLKLANGLLATDRATDAIDRYQDYLNSHPDDHELHMKLGMACEYEGQLTRAAQHYKIAMELRPGFSGAQQNYANVFIAQGRIDEADENYKAALKSEPENCIARSNYLLGLNYRHDCSPQEIIDEHIRCMAGACETAQGQSVSRELDIERPLRIGFMSPDLRTHSVAYFLEPLLESMGGSAFQRFCYADVGRSDATTAQLRRLSDQWRDVAAIPSSRICERIRNDGIDILIDLAGHTSSRNIQVLAGRPAPVQVTWLGYPNTTGLECVDYRITDSFADPEGEALEGTEKLVRLDGCFVVYRALPDAPDVSSLPALCNGFVTFGSCNNLAKVNDDVLRLWAELLRRVEDSRLYFKNPSFTDEDTRKVFRGKLVALGIEASRLELVGRTQRPEDHLNLYANIDIALDTFPYNGTTTTCEAMWMGIPVITRSGNAHAGRVGASLLNAVGHPEWVSREDGGFLRIAAELAADINELVHIRATLRQEMQASGLCDAERFATRFTRMLRLLWKDRRAAIVATG